MTTTKTTRKSETKNGHEKKKTKQKSCEHCTASQAARIYVHNQDLNVRVLMLRLCILVKRPISLLPTPEKSSPGFKGMKNKIIIFTQFSTFELTTNVALQEALPTIALSQQSLLAHRADHYGIMVAWWDFSPSLGYLTALFFRNLLSWYDVFNESTLYCKAFERVVLIMLPGNSWRWHMEVTITALDNLQVLQ